MRSKYVKYNIRNYFGKKLHRYLQQSFFYLLRRRGDYPALAYVTLSTVMC